MNLPDKKKERYRKASIICIGAGIMGLLVTVVLMVSASFDSFGPLLLMGVSICLFFYAWLLRQVMRGAYVTFHKILCWSAGIVLMSFICLEFLVFQGMKRDIPESCRYMIVLGAGLNGDYPSLTLQQRLDASLEFLHEHQQTQVIVSGGIGKESVYTEAEVMKWYLMNHGIGEARIIEEEKATRTDENLLFGKQLVERLSGERVDEILIATSDYHMFRSKLLAEKYYQNVYGIAAQSPVGIRIYYAFREYFALVKMGALEGYEVLNGAKKAAGSY